MIWLKVIFLVESYVIDDFITGCQMQLLLKLNIIGRQLQDPLRLRFKGPLILLRSIFFLQKKFTGG